jgi:hypothetical protein
MEIILCVEGRRKYEKDHAREVLTGWNKKIVSVASFKMVDIHGWTGETAFLGSFVLGHKVFLYD